jgi:selenocysteine-specific elongation factor
MRSISWEMPFAGLSTSSTDMAAATPLTLGTAGHIDHGKTELIRALTGVDTDRLPQERERGISIELGFASLHLPSGRRLSVIDVPGHERFVRTMVAGAAGIDMYLMVVAADDGVMPQTREHAAVLNALGVGAGVIAITKSDLADPELAMLEGAELLPAAELVAVSSRTRAGVEQLRATLERAASQVRSRAEDPDRPARLHVDRVFTIRGAGTVVTGTLWSGAVARGDEVVLLPKGRVARVRAVQVHDAPVERALAGQRVAVNLTGVARDAVARGDVLTSLDADLEPTYLIDCELEFSGSREPEHGERVQVHHGTRESPARLAWLGGRFWQLRLEQPLVPAAGDCLVVRQISPPDTLGGGAVLNPRPRKHGPGREVLASLEALSRGDEPIEAQASSGGADATEDSRQRSDRSSPPPQQEPLAASALALEQRLIQAGAEPPPDSDLDPTDLAALRERGRAIRVAKNLHYHPQVLDDVCARVTQLAQHHGGAITLAQLRDELKTSRKFAQALLEYLDAEKMTIRRGDQHVLRRRAPSGNPR